MGHEFVIVAFGTSPHLDACIESIRVQTRQPVSVRVTTSTPNDHIARAAARHGVDVVKNPVAGGGISADWNFALSVASAELVTLAHQDDVYEPTYSERMVDAMARHPHSLIGFSGFTEVRGDGYCWDSVNNKIKRLLTRCAFGQAEVIDERSKKRMLLSLGNPVCCPSVIFNRAKTGGFEFSAGFQSNLDWDAWLQLADQDGAFAHVAEVLVKKRNHPLNATASLINSRHRLHEDREMFERLWPKPFAMFLAQVYKLGYMGNAKASRPSKDLAGNEQHT